MESIAALIFLAVLLLALPTFLQYLWNTTMPELFGLKALNYSQAFRLLLIASLLFGSTSLLRINFDWPG
jgi:hypothetical protein